MTDSGKEQLQLQIADVLGADAFNRLVVSVPATREKGRLRFWQEQLLEKLASQTAIYITGMAEFLQVFEGAEPRRVPQTPWIRESFLRAIEEFPSGGFSLEETPPEWMADAWQIATVRAEISYAIGRNVSKTGSLCYADDYLAYLGNALTAEQLVELFLFIRDSVGREQEFRPEFERAFPKCVSLLPPQLPWAPTIENVLMQEQGEGSSTTDDDEIPF